MAAAVSQGVYTSALDCRLRGWSVIPLIGETVDNGKRPAVGWQSFQNRMAATDELHHWFVSDGYSAFGVVCGMVSGVIVFDFDDLQAAEKFKQQFPELVNTFTVRSGFRGTPHFYYQVDFPVKSRKLRGGDLKAEGSYVVGAGSVIAGKQWTVIHNVPPLHLSKADFKRVLLALRETTKTINEDHDLFERQTSDTTRDFVTFYRREVLKSGHRNNSLFKTACWMRDCGYLPVEATATLVRFHASQSSLASPNERIESRYREAIATIASAYSRPPRRKAVHPDERGSCLPNILRENLLQQPDGTAFLRTYEGLLLRGISGGQIVTRPQMFALLRGIVGEHSIKCALKMTSPAGQRLFAPSPEPPSRASADTDVLKNKDNKCFVDRQKPPERVEHHRPAIRYIMPTEGELLEWFGLSRTSTVRDAVHVEDLSSAKKYRQTLELKLIERKPGQYPQGWLADRLGVSVRTIYSYHKVLPVQTLPCYTGQPIIWENVQHKLPDEAIAKRAGIDIRGRFLEDERGKRYPAFAGLAQKLLAKGHSLLLKQRTFNFYRCQTEAEIQVSTAKPKPVQNKYFERPEYKVVYFEQQRFERDEIVIPAPQVEVFERSSHPIEPQKPDTEAVETLAIQVKTRTAEIDPERALSLKNAQQLIDLYGISSVRRALSTMKYLNGKGKVMNPAGFMVVASRVNWRKQQTQPVPTPRFRPIAGRKRSALSEPKYDPFWHVLQLLICWMDEDYRAWRVELEEVDMPF